MPLLLVWLLIACWAPELAPPGGDAGEDASGLIFVDGGVVVPADAGAEGIALTEGRVLIGRTWAPGERIEVMGRKRRLEGVGPDHPRCVLLYRVGVGSAAPTDVRFDASGDQMRITRDDGRIELHDAWRGDELPPDTAAAFPSAPPRRAPVPAGCPAEAAARTAVVAPDGHRHAVIEGPLQEASGETNWRVAVFR